MSDTRKNNDLDKPQYNSTLRLLKKLDGIKLDNAKIQVNIGEEQIECIHEKVSSTLNHQGQVFEGLVAVEPIEEDFFKLLELKNRRAKPQISSRPNCQTAPDLMEFYPEDLIKEYPEVEIEPAKAPKLTTIKASMTVANDPIDKYFNWN